MGPVVMASSVGSWGFSLGGEGLLALPIEGLVMVEESHKVRDRKHSLCPTVNEALAQRCSDWCFIANSLRHGESQTSFPNPTITSPVIHPYCNSTSTNCPVGVFCNKVMIVRAQMLMWLKMCLSLSKIWDHVDHSSYDIVRASLNAYNGKFVDCMSSWNVSKPTQDFFKDHHFVVDRVSEVEKVLGKALDSTPC